MKYLDETCENITYDLVHWYNTVNQHISRNPPYWFIPDGSILYFAKHFDALMTGPIARYANIPLAAKSETLEDLNEFFEYIDSIDSMCFLYQPLWIPSQPVFRKYTENYEVKELDEPEYAGGIWKIRYAVLDENKRKNDE